MDLNNRPLAADFGGACLGKTKYRNPGAVRHARVDRLRASARIYRCAFCGYWHVGESFGRLSDRKQPPKHVRRALAREERAELIEMAA